MEEGAPQVGDTGASYVLINRVVTYKHKSIPSPPSSLLLSAKEQPWGPWPRQSAAQIRVGDQAVLENTCPI